MNAFEARWERLASSKDYRAEFVSAQVKRAIPFQIRALLKKENLTQERLAELSGLSQGVVSRAADPDYGNLTLNTIIRVASGFDVAFIGQFVPFSELDRWFAELDEESLKIKTFSEENKEIRAASIAPETDFFDEGIWATTAGKDVIYSANALAPLSQLKPTEWAAKLPDKTNLHGNAPPVSAANLAEATQNQGSWHPANAASSMGRAW